MTMHPFISLITVAKLYELRFELVLYAPDLVSNDEILLPNMKKWLILLAAKRSSNTEVIDDVIDDRNR